MSQRHDDSDDDTYVTVGAAFERLETDEDVQKAKHQKDKEQYVLDSKGRRRFHGAFTGGFSAGYFNTVGSEEGWEPSAFVSTREKKASFSLQKPEDFMDEEDLGAHGIAPRAVSTKDDFSQQIAGTKRAAESHSSVIPGVAPLQNLIVPARSTVGARLLKALGWREGEGVGPKTRRYGPSWEGVSKMYGCARPGQSVEEDNHSALSELPSSVPAAGFMFAPRDITPWQFDVKDDMHGIGYRGIEDMAVLRTQKSTKSVYGMSGAAFGIGALEEEEEEDNVYDVESMTTYDVALAAEGDIVMERKYGWTGGHESDWGLSSFKKTSMPAVLSKKYPTPVVPRDFVPLHKFGATSSTGKAVTSSQKPLSSAERNQLLSHEPGSVFSLLSAEDRERIKKVSKQAKQIQTQTNPSKTSVKQSDNLKPFSYDPSKQARYEAYATGESFQHGSDDMTEWERQREREEFVKTARVIQPLSTSLASKFTRGQEVTRQYETMKNLSEPEPPPISDAEQAARANMFGILTRQTEEWHPHRVMCKRFNVPDPYPGSGVVGITSSDEHSGKEIKYSNSAASRATKRSIDFLHTERLIPVEEPEQDDSVTAGDTAGVTSLRGLRKDSALLCSEVLSDGDTEKPEEHEEYTPRPPLDLFVSIFAESSDESDTESDVHVEPDNTHHLTPATNHKTKWQDLSLPTAHSERIGQDLSSFSASPVAAHTIHRPVITLKSPTNKNTLLEKQPSTTMGNGRHGYGPTLPPDFGNLSKSREEVNESSTTRHKHKHKSHKKDKKMLINEKEQTHKRSKHKHKK